MAISVISSATANGDSVTIGTHQAGDLIVLVAYRNNNTTAATVPTGWSANTSRGGSSSSIILASRIAASSAETSGTWTNATQLGCWVLRGSVGLLSLGNVVNNTAGGIGSGGNINYAALLVASTTANQWILAAAGHRSIDTDLETAPSGLTFRAGVVGASAGELALHDSNGNLDTWASTNYTLTAGTSSAYSSAVCQVCESNYLPAGGGTGGGSLVNSQALVRGFVI